MGAVIRGLRIPPLGNEKSIIGIPSRPDREIRNPVGMNSIVDHCHTRRSTTEISQLMIYLIHVVIVGSVHRTIVLLSTASKDFTIRIGAYIIHGKSCGRSARQI